MNRILVGVLGLGFVFGMSSEAKAQATVWYVDGDATGTPDGTSWTTAFPELGTAIAAATEDNDPPDQIWVAASTDPYVPGSTPSATFQLKSRVQIYGGFDGSEMNLAEHDFLANVTILSGEIGDPLQIDDNIDVIVTGNNFPSQITDATVLDGFTLERSRKHAIHNSFASSPTLANLLIIDCENSDAGGGGAGLRNEGNSSPILTSCFFRNCDANNGYGGAVYNVSTGSPGSNPVFNGCTFDTNCASLGGGAVYNDQFTKPEFRNCAFTNNTDNAPPPPPIDNGGGAM